ncbi:MAG: hypothetical protein OEM01_02035 [Desulfobulbaceae bacterium]|nr:hypothetical protein [Desulfobulbaceae bacterium]
MPASEELWQEIAWDGIALQLPRIWQPTVIHKSYLFFEQDGQPVFAIKWEQVRGRFSAERILNRLQDSLKPLKSVLSPWDVQAELPEISRDYLITGFQCQHEFETSLGILLFCPHCRRATLFQLYLTDPRNRQILHDILQTFIDHHENFEQTWSMYDIRAQLPVQAELKSHEFLVGRFTLSFALKTKTIDLYRFKPAAAILKNQSLQEFGAALAGEAIRVDSNSDRDAKWEYTASGLDRLAVMFHRKPAWIWLQVRVIKDKNTILAVKGTGNKTMDRKLMEQIAGNFTVTETS